MQIEDTIKLPQRFTQQLMQLPETGMGYQVVKVVLTNGKILHQHKVLNASILMLNPQEKVSENEIEKIELEQPTL